jgi:S-adenosylmethionine:tRNA ribosyltransferase-isomerase
MEEHKLSDYNFEFPKELIANRTAGKGKLVFCIAPRMAARAVS